MWNILYSNQENVWISSLDKGGGNARKGKEGESTWSARNLIRKLWLITQVSTLSCNTASPSHEQRYWLRGLTILLTHWQMYTPSLISGEIFNDDSSSRIIYSLNGHTVSSSEALLIGMSNLHYKKGQIQSCYGELPAAAKADCSVRQKAEVRQNRGW